MHPNSNKRSKPLLSWNISNWVANKQFDTNSEPHNLLLAGLILSPPYRELQKAWLRSNLASTHCGSEVGFDLPVRNSIWEFFRKLAILTSVWVWEGLNLGVGLCPSTVPPVFPMLVFQLSKQQNRTRTTSSTVLGTPPNRTRTKKFPLEAFEAVALLVGFSTGNPPKIGTFTAWNRTRNRTRTPPEILQDFRGFRYPVFPLFCYCNC